MGIGKTFDEAFMKAQLAAGHKIPPRSQVFLSVANRYKRKVIFPAKALHDMGFELVTTAGMGHVLRSHGIPSCVVPKISSGDRSILDLIGKGAIRLVINMAASRKALEDDREIRLASNKAKIPCITSMAGLNALVMGLLSVQREPMRVQSLQEYIAALSPSADGASAAGEMEGAGAGRGDFACPI
jgi:carbamoyl-phosphate synthase large subunit